MKSMTGYGSGSVVSDEFAVTVDLKSVNNRFLDIHLRLGSELSSLEPSIKRRIGLRVSRGRIDVTITFERNSQVTYDGRPLKAGDRLPLGENTKSELVFSKHVKIKPGSRGVSGARLRVLPGPQADYFERSALDR